MILTGNFSSKKEWQNTWFSSGKSIGNTILSPNHDGRYSWISNRKLVIHYSSEIPQRNVSLVRLGVESLLSDIGLDFEIVEKPFDVFTNIRMNSSLNDEGRMDVRKLSDSLLEKRMFDFSLGKLTNADLIVSERFFQKGGHGYGYFSDGVAILTNQSQSPSKSSILLAKHEAGHLFGYCYHHYKFKPKGYVHTEFCNMDGTYPILDNCNKCTEALVYFWRGIYSVLDGQMSTIRNSISSRIKQQIKTKTTLDKLPDNSKKIIEHLKRSK